MKRIIIMLILSAMFVISASAEQEPYRDQYDASGMDEIRDVTDEGALEYFSKEGIDPSDPDWVNKLTAESIFSQIGEFLREGGRGPLEATAQMMGIIVLYAAANLSEKLVKYKSMLSYIFMLLSAAGILLPMFSLITSCVSAIQGTATFMTAFVPIYAGILTVGGRGLTAAGMSFLLLFAAEAVNLIASFIILPLTGCYLAMGLVSGIMPGSGALSIGETIKKAATWLFSLSLTVFLGLLSIQTTVNASADSAGLRTVKFVLGSLVPVTGGALSETMTTLTSSMKLLGSSVGMYAVLALGLAVLPIIIELLLWRLSLMVSASVAELFGIRDGVNLFKCADHVLSTLLGIMIFAASLFIISLAVVTGSG